APHLERLRSAAEALQSPVYRVWVEELELEYTYFTGDWHQGIARGERAITLADTLGQRATLVRLLVWTATIYLGRGDLERGRELVERAWSVAGLEEGRSSRRQDLHSVIPAHIGRAALYMAEGRYEAAIEVGREGLALARASNYVIWVLHRLLPILGEAYIRLRDMESARRVRDELRADGERMGHRLALAWADAADALITWQSGKARRGADMLRSAAEAMEERGVVPEAARLRRQLAGRLSDLGEREAALEELRRVHDVFAAMGAQPELKKARLQFKEMDSRPPLLAVAEGYDRLSARESEVARLLAERMSNKAIGKKLGITDRTVGTMITNINRKLGTRNRTEIGDRVREGKI
ncbi:MAG: LuxR C-terminal-related transcriptional regulator, partial [Gemmatimonadota bacterium]|nr:LuxR C-terminal-related transcriptional regulator [Gemmatimonadota bacterium]